MESWGAAPRLVERVEAARARGVRVDCDQYPYTTATNPLRNLLPPWIQEGGMQKGQRRSRVSATPTRSRAPWASRPIRRVGLRRTCSATSARVPRATAHVSLALAQRRTDAAQRRWARAMTGSMAQIP